MVGFIVFFFLKFIGIGGKIGKKFGFMLKLENVW